MPGPGPERGFVHRPLPGLPSAAVTLWIPFGTSLSHVGTHKGVFKLYRQMNSAGFSAGSNVAAAPTSYVYPSLSSKRPMFSEQSQDFLWSMTFSRVAQLRGLQNRRPGHGWVLVWAVPAATLLLKYIHSKDLPVDKFSGLLSACGRRGCELAVWASVGPGSPQSKNAGPSPALNYTLCIHVSSIEFM